MLIYPKAYLKKVQQISINFLEKYNIKALILDVDNTLIDYKANLSQNIIDWATNIKKQGIKLYILSNTNKKEKVKLVADKLEIPYKYFARKPSKGGFKKIQEELKINSENIAVVGDQIFTDIVGGNRSKMFTILVDPIDEKEFWYTAWKRPLENKIKQKLKKQFP